MAALAGSDIATIPYKVLMKMIEHPLTTAGLKIFADAAK
jgi:transaldolase